MQTAGEFLADVARECGGNRITLCETARTDNETAFAVIKLALALKKHTTLMVRSIVEDWDLPRIVRELY